MFSLVNYFRSLDQYSEGRLKSIDFLRGIAATAVLMHHAMIYGDYEKIKTYWFQWIEAIINQGHLGVPLFFVISGFCIHAKTAKSLANGDFPKLDFFSFWKRRFHRLYPNYLAVLFVSMLMVYVAYKLGKDVAAVRIYPEPKPEWMLKDLLAHIFMLHGFHPIFDKGGGNSPMWTIAREEYLYLLYFPLMYLRRYLSMLKCSLVVAAIGIGFYMLSVYSLSPESSLWKIVQSSAIVLWIQWVAGAVAAERQYYFPTQSTTFSELWYAIPLFFIAHYLPKYLTDAISDHAYFIVAPGLWAFVFFIIVNGAVKLEISGRWPNTRFFSFFARTGIFSYSLYLLHHPVIAGAKQFLGPLRSTLNPFLYLMSVVILTILGFLSSLFLFYLLESKFIK